MSREELLLYRGYLNPIVYDRLVNYYATDPVFLAISDLVGYVESVKWYEGISPEVFDIVKRTSALVGIADALAGQIIKDYFNRVSDLVTRHGNLLWLTEVDTLTDANELFARRTEISNLIDFTMGTTETGASRWNRFQAYLNDVLYGGLGGLVSSKPAIDDLLTKKPNIDSLIAIKPSLDGLVATKPSIDNLLLSKPDLDTLLGWKTETIGLADRYNYIQGFIDGLRSQATEEGVLYEIISNRLRWYSRGDVTGILGNFASSGILPTIKGNLPLDGLLDGATFNEIRTQIQGMRNLLGDRNVPGSVFGDLAAYHLWVSAAPDRVMYNYNISGLTAILLRIDGIMEKLDKILDRFKPF